MIAASLLPAEETAKELHMHAGLGDLRTHGSWDSPSLKAPKTKVFELRSAFTTASTLKPALVEGAYNCRTTFMLEVVEVEVYDSSLCVLLCSAI